MLALSPTENASTALVDRFAETPRQTRIAAIGAALATGAVLAWFAPFLVLGLLVVILGATAVVRSPADPITLVSFGVLLLFMIPTRYVIQPLGGAGSPAILVGYIAAAYWGVLRLTSTEESFGVHQPVRVGLAVLFFAVLASYVAGWSHSLSSVEALNSDRTLLVWIGYAGMALLTVDGPSSRSRLDNMLRRMVFGAAFMSFAAMANFLAGFDMSAMLAPPGLTYNVPAFTSDFARSDFTRAFGTADHPIEFGVVAAAILPLALHYAFNDTDRGVIVRWLPVCFIGFAIPMAISRSAIIGAAIVAIYLLPSLPSHHRLTMVVGGLVGVAAMTVVVPGLLGTIRSFFVNSGVDPSVSGRTDDYDVVFETFRQFPIFGRGFGTYTPTAGFNFIDNQYLMTLVESGLVGLLAMLLFLAIGYSAARSTKRRAGDQTTRNLAQSLAAGIAVHITAFATYDALVFRTSAMSLFLLVGAAGALWRLTVGRHNDLQRRLQRESQ